MDEESMEWLGSALWLSDHGLGWLVRAFPSRAVEFARMLAQIENRGT